MIRFLNKKRSSFMCLRFELEYNATLYEIELLSIQVIRTWDLNNQCLIVDELYYAKNVNSDILLDDFKICNPFFSPFSFMRCTSFINTSYRLVDWC